MKKKRNIVSGVGTDSRKGKGSANRKKVSHCARGWMRPSVERRGFSGKKKCNGSYKQA